MSPQLALHLLGPPKLEIDGSPVTADRRKTLALLAYLSLNREQYTREYLSALLWPDYDQDKAFTNLRHTLWETGQAIGEGWILASRDKIGINADASIWLDVAQFDSLIAQSRSQTDIPLRASLLADSVSIYRNHFLTGFSLKDAPPFNEWAFAKSEELRRQLSHALSTLSDDYCSLGQAETALPHAQRLVSLDPLNEASHRQLMQIYIHAGQHNAALKQYQTCEKILRKEMGLDPQPETRELYKKIRKGEIKSSQLAKQKDVDVLRHNLPFQLSKFIGREKELDEIANIIANHRIVTLVGTGGIGKTCLSLKAGEQLLNEYANGVWFVELAALSDPTLVPQAVAKLFNLVEQAGESLTEKLVRVLHQKTTLLILDNCEHLLDACAQMADALLRNCLNLKILATSREPLGITGEAQYHVPSLALPDIQQILEKLLKYESIQLFEERARLVQENFSLTMENVPSIVQICQRLDGIPLAIELAAARVSMLSTEQIAERLDESLSILTSGNRTTLPRHQTLRASIDWSWNLLSDSERTLLRRLAVFAGGWTLVGTEEVCEGGLVKASDLLDLLNDLVEKSLVLFDSENERYSWLETIRQYALEKFQKTDEVEATRNRHCAWLLTWAERVGPELRRRDQIARMKQVKAELDNVRAAVEWGLSTGQAEISTRIVIALECLWDMDYPYRESRQWLTRAFSFRENILKTTLTRGLIEAAWLSFRQNDPESCITCAQEAFALAKELKGQALLAEALRASGMSQMLISDFKKAEEYFEQGYTIYKKLGDTRGIVAAAGNQAQAVMYQGDISSAVELLEKHINLLDNLEDRSTIAYIMSLLGGMKVVQNEWDQGNAYLKKGLFLYHQINNIVFIGHCLVAIAGGANGYKNPTRAARLLGAREAIHESIGANLDPGVQRFHDIFAAQTRAMLSESDFETAWAEGRVMTLDEAVEYALANV